MVSKSPSPRPCEEVIRTVAHAISDWEQSGESSGGIASRIVDFVLSSADGLRPDPDAESGEYFADAQQEGGSILEQFGDLTVEENQFSLIYAFLMRRHRPALNNEAHQLQTAVRALPEGSVNKFVAEFCHRGKIMRELSAEIVDRIKRRNVDQGGS